MKRDSDPVPPAGLTEGRAAGERAAAPGAESAAPIWSALEEVMDPEIPISLVDLGLVYDVRTEAGVVEVDLTFTATGCPCMAFIRQDVEERLMQVEWVREVRINEVWNPPWTKSRITRRGREQMMRMGVGL